MPKSLQNVSGVSRQYAAGRLRPDSPEIDSPDTAADSRGYQRLSFLHGSVAGGGTSDTGVTDGRWAPLVDEGAWEARRELRRHTVEQGFSTFAWPKKP